MGAWGNIKKGRNPLFTNGMMYLTIVPGFLHCTGKEFNNCHIFFAAGVLAKYSYSDVFNNCLPGHCDCF